MPIYEFKCDSCDEEFEILVQGKSEAQCPACGSKELDKQLSVFSASGSGHVHNDSCGCGMPSGGCGLN